MAIAGAGVVLALVIVVAIAMASGHHAKHVSAGATTATTVPPTTVAPKQVSLSEGVLTQDDLGGAWTVKSPVAPLTGDPLTSGPCGSALWAHDVAGDTSDFVSGTGLRTLARLVSSVREAQSPDAADAQAAFVTSSSYAPCLHDLLTLQMALLARSVGGTLDGFHLDPLPLDAAVANKQAYVASVVMGDGSGNEFQLTVDYVDLFTNRYEATLELVTPVGGPIDRDTLIQQASERLAQRLAALPPQGTLASRGV
jgi:hypothetical protein